MNMSTSSINQPIDAVQFGRRILLSRKDLKINQEELGERSGISRGHIAKIERGEVKNPTIDIVYRLADALGVSRAYLLGITEDPLYEVEEESEEQLKISVIKRSPSRTYRTLGAELLDIFDQLSSDSQSILLSIADKLRQADAPRGSESIPDSSEGTDRK